MHVGEAVAMVVADSLTQALDAAEKVAIEYEELPALVDARDAIKPDAPILFDDIAGNLAVDYPGPVDDPANVAAIDAIIASAAHVARVSVVQQRMVMAPMETRGGTAHYDAKSGRYTLRVCSQGAGPMRDMLAAIMGIDKQNSARRHRRRRRRVRAQERRLSGISGAACGRQKIWPPRALDGEPLGSLQQRQSGARQCHLG